MHLIKQDYRKILFVLILFVFCKCQAQGENTFNITDSGYNYYPSISPNEKYVAYFHMIDEDMGAVGNLWIYDLEKKVNYNISEFEHYEPFDSYPTWSNDSKSVIFSSGSKILSIDVNNKTVNELLTTESEEANFFAPNLSPDGDKIAFWVLFNIEKEVYHSIWIWDMNKQDIIRLSDMEYDPQTEVIWYKPQWTSDSKYIIASYFAPSEEGGGIILKNISIETQEEDIISKSLYSSYFQVVNFKVYYSKVIDRKPSLFSFNLKKKTEQHLISSINGVFSIFNNDDKILFSRNDSLFTFTKGNINKLNIVGTNPQISNKLFLYEKWTGNESLLKNTIIGVLNN